MIDRDFLLNFKRVTESHWQNAIIHPDIYGFQFQPGTKWNPGLPPNAITEYEDVLQVRFPHDFRAMLAFMNGTDLPTLNIYGSSREPHQYSTGVYSYPRDLGAVQQRIEIVTEDRDGIVAVLADQGVVLAPEAKLAPIFAHRFVVCGSDLDRCVVLSIMDTDAVVYGDSLQEYLQREFLDVKWWLRSM
jgi:hypothetical protein